MYKAHCQRKIFKRTKFAAKVHSPPSYQTQDTTKLVYFLQFNAYKKGLCTALLSGQ